MRLPKELKKFRKVMRKVNRLIWGKRRKSNGKKTNNKRTSMTRGKFVSKARRAIKARKNK